MTTDDFLICKRLLNIVIDIKSIGIIYILFIPAKCKKKLEADSLCSSIEKNDLINLVRIDTKAVGCPFTGPRKYLLELQQQTCTDDPSLISSSTASLLKFQYPTCWVLRDPSRPVGKPSC